MLICFCLLSFIVLCVFFQRIAGISYLGDFRMTFGENPKKVRNIVDGNFSAFQQLYLNKIKVGSSDCYSPLHTTFAAKPPLTDFFMHTIELSVRVSLDR